MEGVRRTVSRCSVAWRFEDVGIENVEGLWVEIVEFVGS